MRSGFGNELFFNMLTKFVLPKIEIEIQILQHHTKRI